MSDRSTLEAFGDLYDKVLSQQRVFMGKLEKDREQMFAQRTSRLLMAELPQMRSIYQASQERLHDLQSRKERLDQNFRKKWMNVDIKDSGGYHKKLSDGSMPYLNRSSGSGSYAQAAQALASALVAIRGSLPLFAGGRGRTFSREYSIVTDAFGQANAAIAAERSALNQKMAQWQQRLASSMLKTAENRSVFQHSDRLAGELEAKLSLDKLSGCIGEGLPNAAPRVRRGHGRLVFQCGWTLNGAQLVMDGARQPIQCAPVRIPCLLDLVQDKGFVTDSPDAVKSFLLRVLHTLPAGSVVLSVYDPMDMGDFVRYLYPLGDQQEAILGGQGVRSTPNQLEQMLEEAERHIGVINQRYLAGKYPDLVAYNQDAGVTFEPYHILVIHDDPAAWAVNYRPELVKQLARIVDAGAKCGVFVIVQTGQGGTELGLPEFFAAKPAPDRWAAPSAAAVPPLSMPEIIQTGSLRPYWELERTVTWLPPSREALTRQGEDEILHQLERGLQNMEAVEVSPRSVTAVARAYLAAQQAKGVRFGPPALEADDEKGWWTQSSIEGLSAYVGVEKANQKKPQLITFTGTTSQFGALVGGQSRSGKSTFLHTLISELIRRYSPDELELYLVDVKQGAEFQHYSRARLPHARVIALESGAEFALSVLEELVLSMAERYSVFKRAGVSKIDDYRRKSGASMPRVLAVIDEFSGIFEDQGISDRASACLTKLIQQGSAAGMHLILAAQSLVTVDGIPKNVLRQIPQRVLFKVPEADSTLFLSDNNPAGAGLNKAGEGIYNGSNGRESANVAFQGTLTLRDDLRRTLVKVAELAKARGYTRSPVILESTGAASWSRKALGMARRGANGLGLTIPLGMPLSLAPLVSIQLDQGIYENILICVHDDDPYQNVVASLLLCGTKAGAQVLLLDFFGPSGPPGLTRCVSQLRAKGLNRFKALCGQECYPALTKLSARVEELTEAEKTLSKPGLVVLSGLSLASRIVEDSTAYEDLMALLSKGSGVGMYVAVASPNLGAVDSRLGSGWASLFSTVVAGACSDDDSETLVQSKAAARLDNQEQIVLYNRLQGTVQKLRPFRCPSLQIK